LQKVNKNGLLDQHGRPVNMSSYAGASRSSKNMRNWYPSSGDSNRDIVYDLPTLRTRSRDLVRNNALAAGAFNTKITNVIGSGLRLQSRIDRDVLRMTDRQADKLESRIEAEWQLWAGSTACDAARTLTFGGLQELVFRSVLESGECFCLLPFIDRPDSPYSLKIQTVEADRISNPENKSDRDGLVAGVEHDHYGAPTAYYVASQHPGALLSSSKRTWTRYDAFGPETGERRVLHLFRVLRPGQVRGVPDLAPVVELVKMLGRYTDAEVTAAVISSFFTVFVTSDLGDGIGGFTAGSTSGNSPSDELTMGHGNILNLQPGEKVETATPGRPNAAFGPFVEAVLQQIGVALELPYEVLRGHFSASYSASRAALLEAQKMFLARRQWMTENFCQHIYSVWFSEAVSRGRIRAPGFFSGDHLIRAAFLGAEWVGPSFGHIDPVKEARAGELRVANGFSTISAESAAMGRDWERDHVQRAKEQRARLEDGLIEQFKEDSSPSADEMIDEEEKQNDDDKE